MNAERKAHTFQMPVHLNEWVWERSARRKIEADARKRQMEAEATQRAEAATPTSWQGSQTSVTSQRPGYVLMDQMC